MIPIAVGAQVEDGVYKFQVGLRPNQDFKVKNSAFRTDRLCATRGKKTLGRIPLAGPMQIGAKHRSRRQFCDAGAQTKWFARNGASRSFHRQPVKLTVGFAEPKPEPRCQSDEENNAAAINFEGM